MDLRLTQNSDVFKPLLNLFELLIDHGESVPQWMNHAFSLFPIDIFTLLYVILKSQLLEVVMSLSVFLELVEIANDNYQDYKRSERTEALRFREKTNIIGVHHLNPSMIGWMVVGMMVTSGVLGLWMVSRTGWPLLVMGLFSFAVGYGYAGGPRGIFLRIYDGFRDFPNCRLCQRL